MEARKSFELSWAKGKKQNTAYLKNEAGVSVTSTEGKLKTAVRWSECRQ